MVRLQVCLVGNGEAAGLRLQPHNNWLPALVYIANIVGFWICLTLHKVWNLSCFSLRKRAMKGIISMPVGRNLDIVFWSSSWVNWSNSYTTPIPFFYLMAWWLYHSKNSKILYHLRLGNNDTRGWYNKTSMSSLYIHPLLPFRPLNKTKL